MARMISMTLTEVKDNTASYSGDYELENKNVIFSESVKTNTYARNEYGFEYRAWTETNKNEQPNNTGYYIRPEGGNGTKTDKLYGKYIYYYDVGRWRRTLVKESIYGEREYDTDWYVLYDYLSDQTPSDDSIGQKETYYDIEIQEEADLGDGVILYVGWIYQTQYEWKLSWTSEENLAETNSMSINFYPRPKEFYFDNCEQGKKWRVDSGINAPASEGGLIHNLTDFQEYANQWMAWKRQNSYTNCPEFDSPLSAARINLIYSTLGKSSSYKLGDPVSVDIFQGLESIINERDKGDI